MEVDASPPSATTPPDARGRMSANPSPGALDRSSYAKATAIRDERDRERWFIFFLVCVGYVVLEAVPRFPRTATYLTAFPASASAIRRAGAYLRAARPAAVAALVAGAIASPRACRRLRRLAADKAPASTARRRRPSSYLPPELWAHALAALSAKDVAGLAAAGGDVTAAAQSDACWRLLFARDFAPVVEACASKGLPCAPPSPTFTKTSWKRLYSRFGSSWAPRAALGGAVTKLHLQGAFTFCTTFSTLLNISA